MDFLLRTSVLLFCMFACGRTGRVTVSLHRNEASLVDHMLSLEEPHHVCVTGNQAAEAVDSFMLKGTGESRRDLPLTSLISTGSCTVQEALVGNTLVTINADQSDQCAARWKANSLTCDVLFHAHSGPDAEELYRFRLMADNFDCNAAMIVVHDSPELPSNFNSKMNEHVKLFPGHGCTQSPVWINAKSDSSARDVTKAFKNALAANAPAIRKQLQSESDAAGSSFVQGERQTGE